MTDDDKLLQQDEVDALIKAAQTGHEPQIEDLNHSESDIAPEMNADSLEAAQPDEPAAPVDSSVTDPADSLTAEEIDALGEIGNISMGSAATTLSQLLNKRVLITSPTVTTTNKNSFLKGFNMPYLVIKIKFKQGFEGYNVLIIKQQDAIVMANLMMGGDGTDLPEEISEMEISAASEAMNQMIGTASTSLADLLGTNINIAPPETSLVKEAAKLEIDLPFTDPIVVISFRMNIENLLDTNIMQVIDLPTAREQSELLWKSFSGLDDDEETDIANEEAGSTTELQEIILDTPEENAYTEPATPQTLYQMPSYSGTPAPQVDQDKLNLLLDIPLTVSVVLGRTQKPIKDVLQMTPGAIVELETLVGEPVEILVNGKLVARGEVVVVNENFGVKITNIISARDRISTLNAEPGLI
ncbi:MAG TPA: flagellar motor switch phosphatase FliY [Desulfotomaculum sp.]|nr:MAG: hypothetical protein VR67_16565 [Peptococcaceae bacterium BRH_c8a]KJS76611.1 MAG: hypothetical protein JL56_04890 [Desulfotomaculum sp. BICA1-6]HBX23677.1 flagellar motor switch phosphatase FliY [Desulfotomaculum sp.]